MPKRSESPALTLILAPWWVSASLAPISFVVLRWALPAFDHGKPVAQSLAIACAAFAPYVGGFFVVLAALSYSFGRKRRALVDGQSSLETLQQLSWKEFEWMVGEAFRRQGYSVEESIGDGPDGGVDLVLRKDGQTALVQCKQWKVFSVGAPVIRELFGVMTADRAQRAVVITSGKFTRDAQAFAEGKPIDLIDGAALLELVKGVQVNPPPKVSMVESQQSSEPTCPNCGIPMVLRTAGKGANVGNQFWGCRNYPRCKQTLKLVVKN